MKRRSPGQRAYTLVCDAPETLHKISEQFERDGYQSRHPWYEHEWNVMWTYPDPYGGMDPLSPERLRADQLVNHYPSSPFASKSQLAQLPFDFIPLAFDVPEETDAFIDAYRQHPEKLWVRKNRSHRGIRLTSPHETELFLDTSADPVMVQEFIHPPHLICNRKWDMGVYVLLTSLQPIRAYAYNDIVLRFCPKDHREQLDPADIGSYVVADDYTAPWNLDGFARYRDGNRYTVDMLRYCLSQHGSSLEWTDALPAQCLGAVRAIIEHHAEDMLQHCSEYPGGQQQFFELYRFDFVFDEQLNAHLMEVNFSPNLSAVARPPLDDLFARLIRDAFSLVGLSDGPETLVDQRREPERAAAAELARGEHWTPLTTEMRRNIVLTRQPDGGSATHVTPSPANPSQAQRNFGATAAPSGAVERCFSLHGGRVQVSLPSAQQMDLLESRLPPGSMPESTAQADVIYRVGTDLRLFRDDQLRLRAQSPGEVLDALLADLRIQFACHARTALFLHAGAVALDGRGILLPGRGQYGTSTLVAALVAAGASHYSEDYAMLDAQARLHRYPGPIPIEGAGRFHGAPDQYRESEPVPIALVMQARFQPGATWAPRPLSTAEALLGLVENAVQPREQLELMLEILTNIAGSATAIASDRGDTDAVLLDLVQRWPEILKNEY